MAASTVKEVLPAIVTGPPRAENDELPLAVPKEEPGAETLVAAVPDADETIDEAWDTAVAVLLI